MPPSPVDAFFHATDPLDVLRALKALASISQGEVTRAAAVRETGEQEVGGVYCPQLFGALNDADDAGDGSQRTPSVARERWAHVDLGLPVLHPACVPAILQLTELTREELDTILYGSGGIEVGPQDLNELVTVLEQVPGYFVTVLREAGFEPTDLLIRRVPVTPIADRPLLRRPDGSIELSAVSIAYVEVVGRAARERVLVDVGAPQAILGAEAGLLQRAFDRVLAP